MGSKDRFIGTHTKCMAVKVDDSGHAIACHRSYGHDDPKTRKTPTDHYDPDTETTWPSEKAERARRRKEKGE
jgi:hypothetical protein